MDKTGKTITKRVNPNDVFVTPDTLVNLHFDLTAPYLKNGDQILDPCAHVTRKYYNKFIEHGFEADWCEITEGRDFFEYDGEATDVVCSNPPYSLIDMFLEKIISFDPRVVSLLIGFANLTTRRMEMMEKAGYRIAVFNLTKVFKWYGMSLIVVWVRDGGESVVGFDRKVHR